MLDYLSDGYIFRNKPMEGGHNCPAFQKIQRMATLTFFMPRETGARMSGNGAWD